MTVDGTLVAHLVADSALTALVGSRVWPIALAQTPTLPAVTYRRISVTSEHDRSSRRADLARVRYQFDCWASTFDGARAVAVALKDALGTLTNASDPMISHALTINELDDVEPTTNRWRVIIDAHVYHEE